MSLAAAIGDLAEQRISLFDGAPTGYVDCIETEIPERHETQ
jgi:hypothetical protein